MTNPCGYLQAYSHQLTECSCNVLFLDPYSSIFVQYKVNSYIHHLYYVVVWLDFSLVLVLT